MIYTLTLNPAVDYIIELNTLRQGHLNRTSSEQTHFGGKGINVSIMLNNLGNENIALGFLAGFTGKAIEEHLKNSNLRTDFIRLKEGISRINIKIADDLNQETEINGQGPEISPQNLDELFTKLSALRDDDILVLSGNVPSSLPNNTYEIISEYILSTLDKNVSIIVDAAKNSLFNALKYQPFLIKPNLHELEDIFETKITSNSEVVQYAKFLKDKGAQNVLVSMGNMGAILLTKDNDIHTISVIHGNLVNSIGSGDSMIAGFISGYIKTKDFKYALKLGAAAGTATAFTNGIASKDAVLNMFEKYDNITTI